MLADPDTLQGQPHLPHDLPEVSAVIEEHNVRLVYIDPWVSSVSGGLRLRDTQDARRAIDPLGSRWLAPSTAPCSQSRTPTAARATSAPRSDFQQC